MISFVYNRVFEPAPTFPEEYWGKEEQEYKDNEHAYSVLHAEFPSAPLEMINLAVMTDWNWSVSDEQNIITCKYLEDYE